MSLYLEAKSVWRGPRFGRLVLKNQSDLTTIVEDGQISGNSSFSVPISDGKTLRVNVMEHEGGGGSKDGCTFAYGILKGEALNINRLPVTLYPGDTHKIENGIEISHQK